MKTGLLVLAALLFAPQSLSAQPAKDSPSYAKHVRPFFVKYCLECHNAQTTKRGLDLETYAAMREGSDTGAVIVPGKPDESKLVLSIEHKEKPHMPPAEAKRFPTKGEIAQVRAWVAAGAKDDSGSIKVAIPDIKPRIQRAAPIRVLAYARNARLCVAAGHQVVEYALANASDRYGERDPITALAIGHDGEIAATAHGKPGQRSTLSIFRRGSGSSKRVVWPVLPAHQDIVLDAVFGPKDRLLATCSYDTTVKLWDVEKGKEIRTLKEHSDAVYGISFSPDGKLLASGGADRAVKVWDVASGKLLYTLGDSNDWVYAVAFSPDGKHVAAGGVDRSIRVWEISPDSHKLAHSTFAHEKPILRLVYSKDGKTLYSLGEERIVKAWTLDAKRLIERKVYDRQPESVLALALSPDGKQLALGRYDGVVVILDEATGKVLHEIQGKPEEPNTPQSPPGKSDAPPPDRKDPFPEVKEQEPNDSPRTGQKIKLPATVAGALDRSGDVDFYRFEVRAGQELGVQVVAKGKTLEPFLQLVDEAGNVLRQSSAGVLGHTFAQAGTFAIGVRDRELRGGLAMSYRLRIGDIPVVTSLFPMGLQRGADADIHLQGVNLQERRVRVKAPAEAAIGSRIALPLKGAPLGPQTVIVGEFPEVLTPRRREERARPPAAAIPVPGTANGSLFRDGQTDLWTFHAKKGERLIVEVHAHRLGSDLDSVIEIVDEKGRPVPRATLRCLARTHVAFRDHDSAGANIRIEAWGELAVNDYIYVGGELLKIRSLPTHPDADCIFFSDRGQRSGFLDTTPTHLSNGLPMYKVAIHPPGTKFPRNGFPVVTLYYRNDDGGPGYGRDSRIFFDPPADGEYQIKIGDAGGRGGDNFGYRLTVRPPRPSFNVTFKPTSPSVYKGGAIPLTATAERIDGYEGEIRLKLENLPPGFSAPATSIPAGENSTAFALFADADAAEPAKSATLRLVADAVIAGKKIVKEMPGGVPKLIAAGEIVATTEESEVTLKPGGAVKMVVNIERRGGFKERVPIDVRGLPHGVKVLDIGLNGILITERETRRTIVIYAEPWVTATDHPFVIVARGEGKNSEHAAKSVLLKVVR